MDLSTMRTILRRDLKEEDPGNYRWSDDELDRHITHAVKEFSESVPLPVKATMPTTPSSRVIDISSLTDRVMVETVEYPVGKFPPCYQRFALWGHILTLFGDEVPNGSDCNVYYGVLHTLDAGGSTIPTKFEDLIAVGACAFALETFADHALAELVQTALESTKTALDKVSGQVTKSETALVDAATVATDIQTKLDSAATEINKASSAIATAIASGIGSIDEAIQSYLTLVQTRIDAAVTNLSSANGALGSIPTRLSQAVDNLATGDDFINTVNVGGNVAHTWAEYAQREVEIALGYNRQADGYLGEAAQNLDGASRELGAASELDKKRSAHLIAGARYIDAARAYISSASELNHKRQAFLQTAQSYIASTTPFIQEANQHQADAAQYNRLSKSFATRAKTKLSQFRRELKRLGRRNRVRIRQLYR